MTATDSCPNRNKASLRAEVTELGDVADSKSAARKGYEGSTPSFGIFIYYIL